MKNEAISKTTSKTRQTEDLTKMGRPIQKQLPSHDLMRTSSAQRSHKHLNPKPRTGPKVKLLT